MIKARLKSNSGKIIVRRILHSINLKKATKILYESYTLLRSSHSQGLAQMIVHHTGNAGRNVHYSSVECYESRRVKDDTENGERTRTDEQTTP